MVQHIVLAAGRGLALEAGARLTGLPSFEQDRLTGACHRLDAQAGLLKLLQTLGIRKRDQKCRRLLQLNGRRHEARA